MQEVLNQNVDSPLMRASLEKRIANLQTELDSMGSIEYYDTSLKLWFGGEAVYGSMGIFSDFASKTSVILSNMIATKYTEIVTGKLSQSERGKIKGELQTGYSRVKQSNITETYLTMEARLSGIFTDSGTFEFVDDEGHRRTGDTTEDLDDEQLTEYARLYTNKMCKLIMKEYRETPNHGKPKAPTYELLQIQDINN